MAVVNDSSMVAVVRSQGVGFTQSWSHDGGHHWLPGEPSSVAGASSKPALASWEPAVASAAAATRGDSGDSGTEAKTRHLALAYNVRTREQMALSTSTDGGVSWQYYATLDTGKLSPGSPHETSDAYPTVVLSGKELLTAWSTYGSGGGSGGGGYNTIKLARTALPQL